jgi:membrane fusion protein, multidrug efflux system
MILIVLVLGIAGAWFWLHRSSLQPAEGAPGSETAQAGENRAGHGKRRGSSLGPQGEAVPVVAGTVQVKDVPIFLNGIGTVQAFNTVTVRAQVTGKIQEIAFKEGQDVKQGDLLVVIDPRPYQAQLGQAVAKKAEDEAQLNNAKVLFQRDTDLLARKVIDQQTYDTQKYLVDQFQGLVQSDQSAIEDAQTQLSYTQITAPIDGRVGIRLVDVGNLVQASDAAGIVVITQLKPISVVFTLPQQDLQKFNANAAQGVLKVIAYDRENTKPLSEGVLSVVNNQIDQATGAVQLKATFANTNLELWPGQFINARLQVRIQKDGLVVPASVVQRGPQGSFAYVINQDNTAAIRTIDVGQIADGQALIESGLTAGEQVVVDGQYRLQPGSKVEITSGQQQTRLGEAAPDKQPHGRTHTVAVE